MNDQALDIDIPMDIYESAEEIVVVVPVWGASDIEASLERTTLVISWVRKPLKLKENLVPNVQDCYRWPFMTKVDLPQNVYFDKISAKLTKENILVLIVPKIIIPEKVKLQVDVYK